MEVKNPLNVEQVISKITKVEIVPASKHLVCSNCGHTDHNPEKVKEVYEVNILDENRKEYWDIDEFKVLNPEILDPVKEILKVKEVKL